MLSRFNQDFLNECVDRKISYCLLFTRRYLILVFESIIVPFMITLVISYKSTELSE